MIAVSSALAGRSDTTFTVNSSLDGKTVLPLRSHWIAFAKNAQPIDHVDFFIDGFHAWTEHPVGTEQAAWYFGGQGNWLIPTFLNPGVHKFVVRAYDVADQMAVDTVQARVVAPPAPPAKFAGSWKKGTEKLLIAKIGWTLGHLANGGIVFGPEIMDRPELTPYCGSNPPHAWKAAIAKGDKRMTLAPVGTDPCAVRVTVFKGTWTRAH